MANSRVLASGRVSTNGRSTVPTTVSGLSVWLDASLASSVTITTNVVSTWADQSGNARNFTWTDSNAAAPTYSATGFNGSLPGITFASTKFLDCSVTTYHFSNNGANAFTAFAVFTKVAGVDGSFMLCDSRATGGTVKLCVDPDSKVNTAHPGVSFGAGNLVYTPALPAVAYWSAPAGATILTTTNLNNTQGATTSDTYNNAVLPMSIGQAIASDSMTIGEIIIYNSVISARNSALLWDYLARKWGV